MLSLAPGHQISDAFSVISVARVGAVVVVVVVVVGEVLEAALAWLALAWLVEAPLSVGRAGPAGRRAVMEEEAWGWLAGGVTVDVV